MDEDAEKETLSYPVGKRATKKAPSKCNLVEQTL